MKKILLLFIGLLAITSCSTPKKVVSKQYVFSNNVIIRGGDGSSFEKAKIVIAENSRDGIASEYEYLGQKYGEMQQDWILVRQSLHHHKDKPYDVLRIKLLKEKKDIDVYFEISSFFGKY